MQIDINAKLRLIAAQFALITTQVTHALSRNFSLPIMFQLYLYDLFLEVR